MEQTPDSYSFCENRLIRHASKLSSSCVQHVYNTNTNNTVKDIRICSNVLFIAHRCSLWMKLVFPYTKTKKSSSVQNLHCWLSLPLSALVFTCPFLCKACTSCNNNSLFLHCSNAHTGHYLPICELMCPRTHLLNGHLWIREYRLWPEVLLHNARNTTSQRIALAFKQLENILLESSYFSNFLNTNINVTLNLAINIHYIWWYNSLVWQL